MAGRSREVPGGLKGTRELADPDQGEVKWVLLDSFALLAR